MVAWGVLILSACPEPEDSPGPGSGGHQVCQEPPEDAPCPAVCAPEDPFPHAPAPPAAAPAKASDTGPAEPRVVFDQQSQFGRVLVVDQGNERTLRFGSPDALIESMRLNDRPEAVPMECIRFAAAGLLFPGRLDRLLVLGLGGGNFPALAHRLLPEAEITAVEIDPVVVEVARRFFDLPDDPRLRVVVEDAATFVKRPGAGFDLVLHDTYPADGTAGTLWTQEFFARLRRMLSPGGVVVANLAAPEGKVDRVVVAAFRRVFPACSCFMTPDGFNLILVGQGAGPVPDRAVLESRLSTAAWRTRLPFDLTEVTARLGTGCP
jgi:spermidine synthase